MTTMQRWWQRGLAVGMACLVSATPLAAQDVRSGSGFEVTRRGTVARAAAAPRPMPMTEAIRAAAIRHSAALTQAPPPRRRTAAGCVGRIALFGALGAGTGLVAAGALLASTGGSDDTSGILTKYGVFGAGAGALVGALLCAA